MKSYKFIANFIFRVTPTPIKHYIRDRLSESTVRELRRLVNPNMLIRYHHRNKARQLEDKLWGGFSTTGVADLIDVRDDEARSSRVRMYAAWALARWHMCQCDYQSSLHNIILVREWCTWKDVDIAQVLLEADCYVQLEAHEKARVILDHALTVNPDNSQLLLALANTYLADDDARLDIINTLFGKHKLLPVLRRDENQRLSIENLVVKGIDQSASTEVHECQPLVTVIMPVFQAAKTLHIAVESLLKQTWHNLEIIIVDDCSPDETFEVAQRYETADPRVKAMRQSSNQGAYAARNLGLTHATGEYVTTHDADDWSHPQKIELQVQDLIKKDDRQSANVTHWIRVFPDLLFRGTPRPTNHMIQWNHSSLMMRRSFLEELGGWDHVRIAGDTELIWRIEKLTGKFVARLLPEVPLSFALEEPDSLTRQSKSHVWTIQYGVRREYREMIRYWHEQADRDALLPGAEAIVKYGSLVPLPSFIRANKVEAVTLDILLVMDASKVGDEHDIFIQEINRALEKYDKVGIFHWPHYHANTTLPAHAAIRRLAYQGKLAFVVSGERVTSNEIWVLNPFSLQYQIDRPPEVFCEQCKALIFYGAKNNLIEVDEQVVNNIEANIMYCFSRKPDWIVEDKDLIRKEYVQEDLKNVLVKIEE